MFLFRSQERPYLCEESNIVCSVLLCHITLCLCFCISSVNWCTHVVLISYSLPPFDILIVYACTYVCILYAMLFVNPNFMYVTIKYLLTYLLTYLIVTFFSFGVPSNALMPYYPFLNGGKGGRRGGGDVH